jgi:hypothetical protein
VRSNVEHIFPQFSGALEGTFACPYSDVRRLITTARGALIDPVERALPLEWYIGDRRATEEEIRNDWRTIKDQALRMSDAKLQHWTATEQAPLTSIRLRAEFIDALTLRQLRANYAYIEAHLMPGIGEFPADAQLGVSSLAWALGAGFDKVVPPRTEFVAACNAGNWLVAGAHARLRESGNAGVVARNKQQDLCFSNAATVKVRGLDPAALWWPNACPKEDSLKTLAVKALELGLAKDSVMAPPDDEEQS